MRFKYFCSEKHKTDWTQEFNVLGVERLQDARVRMEMEAPQARFTPAPQVAVAPSGLGAERRSAARVDLDAPLRVTVLNGDNAAHSGQFVNASAKGMKITMGIEILLSTRIRVDCGSHSIVGDVRHCQTGTTGYVLGIETIEWIDRREPSRPTSTLGDLYGTSNSTRLPLLPWHPTNSTPTARG